MLWEGPRDAETEHYHSRITYVFSDDFPQRLERFREESGLSWAELARRLGPILTPQIGAGRRA